MKIEKYKRLKSGKYQVILENGISTELYEDTILKFDLLLKKEIMNFEEIEKFDFDLSAYYIVIKYLNIRARSKKEIHDYLDKKGFSKDVINQTIKRLEKQGYINDLNFAKMFLNNKLITTANGPLKIKKELLKHEISDIDIENALEEYTIDIQIEKIRKQINRIMKSNRNKGNVYLKRKMYNDLNNEGFDSSLIEQEINNINFIDDKDLAKKEYERLYKKLSRKYKGSELELKINQKLYQKGFHYEK